MTRTLSEQASLAINEATYGAARTSRAQKYPFRDETWYYFEGINFQGRAWADLMTMQWGDLLE